MSLATDPTAVSTSERYRWVLLWTAAQLGALAWHVYAFATLLAITAGLGGWQIAGGGSVGWQATTRRRNASRTTSHTTSHNSVSNRTFVDQLASTALAALLVTSTLFDLRLTGLVLIAAVFGSLAVGWASERSPAAGLGRASKLVLSWLLVGVAAGAAVAIANESVSAAVVLVCVASAYDTGLCLWSSADTNPLGTLQHLALRLISGLSSSFSRLVARVFRRPAQPANEPQLPASTGRSTVGHLAGLAAALAIIYAVTAVSVPPYAPADALKLMIVALVTLPLGHSAANNLKKPAPTQPTSADPPTAPANPTATPTQSAATILLAPLTQPWAMSRLDVLIFLAPAWAWAVDVVGF